MELSELGQQYLLRADALTERIHRLNGVVDKLTGNDKLVMKRRISTLYADAFECRRCAFILANYTKGSNLNEQNNLQS